MKNRLALLVVLMAFAVPAFGAAKAATVPAKPVAPAPRPALVLPAYPGAKLVMDVSLSDQNMLDSLKALLSAVTVKAEGNPISQIAGQLDLKGLSKALEGLKEVKVLQFSVTPASGATADKVSDFYANQLYKEKGWTRVFWRSDEPDQALAVYSLPQGNGLFVTAVDGDELVVGRTCGKIDLSKVFDWAAKTISVRTSATPPAPVTVKK